MPILSPSQIEKVFEPFKTLLVSNQIFTLSTCVVSVRKSYQIPETSGSPFCIINPFDFDQIASQVDGAGLYVSGVEGIFSVKPRVRNLDDPAYLETNLFLNQSASLGLYTLVQQIINVLHLCFPLDSQGNFLCEKPPHLVSISKPDRESNAREWGGVDMNFYVSLYMKTSVN